ncbi:TFIIB-type zinc ribbon-containing protein [Pseudoalteromonas rubra]|uniref:Transcription factor zinc-finger domain-containing protein n=1 Tax=Pseudoalteromonas rubra TaxID=43658 RepID=A0A0U3GUK9_9GAMM|nr:zf-TFIIB domain-containing protein [Pseudoalteromonas rubra]ALU42851.1 hypothetical protein AT705_07790 [Pseudoalteromonas rubra]
MKCTSCGEGQLRPGFIEGLFRAHSCDQCQGDWILIEDYVAWKERNPDYQFAEQIEFGNEAEDSKRALFCPVSGTLMRKFRISASSAHRVDYSVATGGIWLDKGEWHLLKAEGLAGALNQLVTQQWQQQIREDTSQQNFADIYQDKFGDETYQRLRDIRTWLNNHPQKADLRAYLMAEDPYSAER